MARTRRPATQCIERLSRRQLLGGAAGLGAAAAFGMPFPTLAGATAAVKSGAVTRAAVQTDDSQITVVQNIDTNTLDPQFHNDPVSLNLALHLFDTPFILDQEANVVPRFLESYENIDELTWEFRLPQGATFHNGEPVNAAAVRFSIERIATGDPPVPDPFIHLSSYSAFEEIDEYTFRLITASPAPTLPGLMTKLWVLPPKYFTETPFDELQSNPVGSGPYRFVEWAPDDHITLVANEEYWGGAPSIKQINFRPVSELSTRVALLQAGEADVITNVAPDQAALLEEGDGTKVSQVTSGRIIFVGMRTDVPPLDDVRVRRAFNHAVDFDTINEQILNGIGQRAATITTPQFANPDLQPIAYDPELAKSLLQEAGVEGLSLTMDSHTGVFLKDIEIAQAIAQNLREVGVEVEVQPLDSSVLRNKLDEGDTSPLFFTGYGSPFIGQVEVERYRGASGAPDDRGGSIGRATHWNNEEYIQLYQELTQTFGDAERLPIFHRLQAIVMEELPIIPIWFQVSIYGLSKRLEWEAPPHERATFFNATLTAE